MKKETYMKWVIGVLLSIVFMQSSIMGIMSYNTRQAINGMHEYQIELEMDSAALYDHGRYVGSYYFPEYIDDFRGIDSLFIKPKPSTIIT